MPNFKNEREKRKYYKQLEKQRKKEAKELAKEVDKEYKEKYPKDHSDISNKLAKKMVEFFDMLWPDDEEQMEQEFNDLLTKEEKQKLEEDKKEEKKMIIKAVIIISSVVIFTVIFCYTYAYFNRTHYEKVISPMIKEYFLNHYNAEIKTDKNNFICYTVRVEDKDVEKCTNLLITTTDNKKHVLTIDDTYAGDDVNQESFKTSYQTEFNKQFEDINIVYDDAQLSYYDFYHDYNPYLDYIKILPVGMNYNEMLNTNKITVLGKVLYQGELSIDRVQYFLKNFSDDSMIYFIKLNQGLPKKISIITKSGYFEVNISNSLVLENNQNITYYELDRSINGTNSCTYKDVANQGIRESTKNRKYQSRKEVYEFKQGKSFQFDFDRQRRDEPQKPHFYLLKFSNGSFINNFALFSGSRGNYTELDKEEYPLFITMTLGSETYVIGNESFGIALKTEKKDSFLCNLGLC